MSLSGSLANALSGLAATSRLTQVSANNLANALTDSYGRQIVNLGSSVLGGQGAGVAIQSVTRLMAPEVTAARRQADGDAAASEPQAEALARLAAALGEATDADGLFRRLESFETSLRFLAETPESAPRQNASVQAAKDLVRFLNGLSSEVAQVRQHADSEIAASVDLVNRNLVEIEKINAQIQHLSATDVSVPGLIDNRERLIDEINAIIPVRTQPRPDNAVHLYTEQGLFLLQESAARLEFTASPVITAAMVYDPAAGGALSGLTLRGVDIAPGATTSQRIDGGSLAGLFAVRDRIAVDFNARIDQFAADLIARFQDPAVDATLAPADPGLFTDNGAALDPLTIDGLSGRISINALVDPDLGGDPARLRDGLQSTAPGPVTSDVLPRNLLDALTVQRPGGSIPGLGGSLSASQMISGIVEITGMARTDAELNAARLTTTREALAETEADRIGVDTDEELQSLIEIEQAYAANAQVIQTASRMLQEILEIR